MNCELRSTKLRRGEQAFTLAEVLAALMFVAIVIPVSIQALRLASLAGEVAERKLQATRVAERVLNESIVTTNWNTAAQRGTALEGFREYRWTLHSEIWSQAATNSPNSLSSSSSGPIGTVQPQVNDSTANQVVMNLVSVDVLYQVQDKEYSVRLSTLANPLQ